MSKEGNYHIIALMLTMFWQIGCTILFRLFILEFLAENFFSEVDFYHVES